MSKKYTCAGRNSGGRVKGYGMGGLIQEMGGTLTGAANLIGGGKGGGMGGAAESMGSMSLLKKAKESMEDTFSGKKSEDASSLTKPYRRGGRT